MGDKVWTWALLLLFALALAGVTEQVSVAQTTGEPPTAISKPKVANALAGPTINAGGRRLWGP